MTASTLAQRAYAPGAAPIRTARSVEYDVFARITHRMIAAARRGKPGFSDLAQAIYDNRRLWTVLATDVAGEGNLLPDELRARIVYLAEFTHVHSAKVLSDGASIKPLVETNTAIMRGLNPNGAGQ